ncbi:MULTISPECIES: helix-turn-helix domain-containing protein [Streptococcus]|uniref:helix-turn-helix domain-containing protein n=1 Tax=Streptococcus TaxID=1301 RepID=UPI000E3E28AA|nr:MULTISPECIES: helix-turn-helix transcriptional regulator [Streptococcus]MBZ2134853.1 helix-turn-helix transcriptional regulator [Streptococcus gordonii]MCC3172200.1 putative transcriptional regulator [Streptococcus sanguinis]
MKISYSPLWRKLEEKELSRTELRESVKLGSSTYSKLIRNQSVTTDTLLKISAYLSCDVSELIESKK